MHQEPTCVQELLFDIEFSLQFSIVSIKEVTDHLKRTELDEVIYRKHCKQSTLDKTSSECGKTVQPIYSIYPAQVLGLKVQRNAVRDST